MADGIRRIAQRVKTHEKRARVAKTNRMLSLSEPRFAQFQAYCRSKGITASEVVDQLIGEFMIEVESDKEESEEPVTVRPGQTA